jgi:hypothetical protein
VAALQERRVDDRERVGDRLALARALEQGGELDELEVAHDRVRDVEIRVEAQLAEPPADLRDRGEELVAQQPEGRLERLGRPKSSSSRSSHAADRLARASQRRGTVRAAAVASLG